ncbi:polysaccharide biosynthesis tyrosine autokinase [Gordonia amicalis]
MAEHFMQGGRVGVFDVKVAAKRLMRDWWVIALCSLILGVLAFGISVVQKPVYEATATLYVTVGNDSSAQDAYQGALASQQRVSSYSQLIDSEAVIREALLESGLDLSVAEVRDSVEAYAEPETVLVDVAARSTDEAMAVVLANAMANSLTGYVHSLEIPSSGKDPLAKLTVVTPASATGEPVSPRVVRNTLLSLIGGVLLGAALVGVRARIDTKVRTIAEVEASSGSTVLSSVPADSTLRAGGPLDFARGGGASAESYRRLRANLAFVGIDSPARVILLTSPNPNEGKTTTALNLAAALAEAGKRVLLIDGDLRKPSLGGQLPINPSVGLTNLLRGDARFEDVVQSIGVADLDVLACGPEAPNPSELLGSEKLGSVVGELREMYEYIVIDSSPLVVADALLVAKHVDGVLAVVRSGQTKAANLRDAISQLHLAQVSVLGVVLNAVSDTRDSQDYGYYLSSSAENEDGQQNLVKS